MRHKFTVQFSVEIEFDPTDMTIEQAVSEITESMHFPCEDTDNVTIIGQCVISEEPQKTMTVDGKELPVYGEGENAYVIEVDETYTRKIVVMAGNGEEANDLVPSLDITMRPEDYLSDSFTWGEPMIVDTDKKNNFPMNGTIKSHFPKPGHKGTFIIIVSPDDGSMDIYDEMVMNVVDKRELPEVGSKVELVKASLTWAVKG